MKCFNFKSAAALTIAAAALIACQKEQEKNNGELKGYVYEDLKLEAGKSYTLVGSLQVKAPATLTIEKGVTSQQQTMVKSTTSSSSRVQRSTL